MGTHRDVYIFVYIYINFLKDIYLLLYIYVFDTVREVLAVESGEGARYKLNVNFYSCYLFWFILALNHCCCYYSSLPVCF